ncbi:transporter family-2 protein [Zhongshania antarctica]|uniref:Transporter family-2 protein n=1 Tax=Zhongshania antarctica TaxID=641702 RepID=A0A840QZF6_9GAMM|nr:DMT family transporter [Zhongshania antarctica]MBB5186095.1 transporter family-2 protein [Zhongshania antarctica]
MSNTLIYSSVMLVAGLGIPVMAALNGGLGERLQSPAHAAAILFFIGLILATAYLLATVGLPANLFGTDTPRYLYFGGFFVVFYILSITWVAPRFGVSNAISFVLLGQLIAMTIIDHFGLLGVQKYAFGAQRGVGLVLMALGVFMVLNKTPKV